jgi:hypothetical protein
MSYVLPAVVIGITGILLVLIFRSQKFKKRAAAAYQEILDDLSSRTEEHMQAHGLHSDEQHPFVSDNDEGFLLTLDNTNRQLLIADKDTVSMLAYQDIASCSLDIQWKDHHKKQYNWVTVLIKTSHAKKPLTIPLGTKPAKAEGLRGRYILQSAQQIQSICEHITAQK